MSTLGDIFELVPKGCIATINEWKTGDFVAYLDDRHSAKTCILGSGTSAEEALLRAIAKTGAE